MQGGLHEEVILVFLVLLVLRIIGRRRSRAKHEDGEKQSPNIEHFHTVARHTHTHLCKYAYCELLSVRIHILHVHMNTYTHTHDEELINAGLALQQIKELLFTCIHAYTRPLIQ